MVWFYSQIIVPEIFTIPPLGTINVHGALLPQYRGGNILNWVIINGETKTGVTLHYIDTGVDTGDIIAQKKFSIEFEDTARDVKKKIICGGLKLLEKELPKIYSRQNNRIKQDDSKAHHYSPRKPENGEFSWDWSSEKIYNLIRGLVKPWPGAFYYTPEGEKVVIDFFIPYSEVIAIQNNKYYKNIQSLRKYLRRKKNNFPENKKRIEEQ